MESRINNFINAINNIDNIKLIKNLDQYSKELITEIKNSRFLNLLLENKREDFVVLNSLHHANSIFFTENNTEKIINLNYYDLYLGLVSRILSTTNIFKHSLRYHAGCKLRQLGFPNCIFDNSDSKLSRFDCQYRSDSKPNDEIVPSITISI